LSNLAVLFFNPLKQYPMKKLFRLGMIATVALSFCSCSKSSKDVLAKEKTAEMTNQSMQQKKIAFLKTRNLHTSDVDTWLDAAKFYPFINQPAEMQLGVPGATLSTGQTAVFYIILSDDVANLTATSATLTASDDATGDEIATYNLISYQNLGTVDAVVVPAELTNVPFMCAIVNLNDQFTNRTISLSSHIEFNNIGTGANLSQAFTVTP
jgi:hypothetical protein